MKIVENTSLRPHNTFHTDVAASFFSTFTNMEELSQLVDFAHHNKIDFGSRFLVLGGGSNVLFTKDFDGLVLKNEWKGISLENEDDQYYYVKAWGGENWHNFVQYCISQEYAGLENLSLIPGCVGASPMQNIGAYGVEVKDVFHSLDAYHLLDKSIVSFSLKDCDFKYRESVFKKKYKNQFVILNVTYRLLKKPVYNVSYGAIKNELERMNISTLSIKAISQAVINIRNSKLPDPAKIGNAGSFFKNPQIPEHAFNELKGEFPSIPGYAVENNEIKLAAGWLIEQCGWKGFRTGDAGCHAQQSLVLVNYGNATGKDIFDLSERIIESVGQKFGVKLEREVNIY